MLIISLNFNEKQQKEAKKELLSKILYSKQFTYLIHGLSEGSGKAWETRN